MRIWLGILALLIVAMIIVGGATRLTDSGLSITEWQLITGILPPLNEAQWLAAFGKYKTIPEYELVNRGMTLDAFKYIYWWEWAHRFLGRFVGVAFVVPYIFFLVRGQVGSALNRRLLLLLGLGALQGFMGWYMVSSGLVDRIDVSQYRLALHLGLAFLILGVIVWTILSLSTEPPDELPYKGRAISWVLTSGIFVQILLGALVAGTHAGLSHNTWPLMDGNLLPDGLFAMQPWWINFFENVRTIQFDHRILAYALLVLAVWHALRQWQSGGKGRNTAFVLAFTLLIQSALGIWTLLMVVPLNLALLHQAVAIAVFLVAVYHLHIFHGTRDSRRLQNENGRITDAPVISII